MNANPIWPGGPQRPADQVGVVRHCMLRYDANDRPYAAEVTCVGAILTKAPALCT